MPLPRAVHRLLNPVSRGLCNWLKADLSLYDISKLVPEILKKLKVKGVIFDLDDTLMPRFSGKFPSEVIQCLKMLKCEGIPVGIISNNMSRSYSKVAHEKLVKAGLEFPFIRDARKPWGKSYTEMCERLGLSKDNVLMVGDSRVADIWGAKVRGMKTLHARWFTHKHWLRSLLVFCREVLAAIVLRCLGVMRPQTRLKYLKSD